MMNRYHSQIAIAINLAELLSLQRSFFQPTVPHKLTAQHTQQHILCYAGVVVKKLQTVIFQNSAFDIGRSVWWGMQFVRKQVIRN